MGITAQVLTQQGSAEGEMSWRVCGLFLDRPRLEWLRKKAHRGIPGRVLGAPNRCGAESLRALSRCGRRVAAGQGSLTIPFSLWAKPKESVGTEETASIKSAARLVTVSSHFKTHVVRVGLNLQGHRRGRCTGTHPINRVSIANPHPQNKSSPSPQQPPKPPTARLTRSLSQHHARTISLLDLSLFRFLDPRSLERRKRQKPEKALAPWNA